MQLVPDPPRPPGPHGFFDPECGKWHLGGCPEHSMASKRRGGPLDPCRRVRLPNGEKCMTHSPREVQRRMWAEEAVWAFGSPREVTPVQALLEEVHRSAGIVQYLEEVVRQLDPEKIGPETENQTSGGLLSFDQNGNRVPSVWVQMLDRERKNLVRVSKVAIDCGIAERQVRIAEKQGELLAGAIRAILTDLGLGGDPRAPEVIRRHLSAITVRAREA